MIRPKLAIDARMAGHSGIGVFLRNLIPTFAAAQDRVEVTAVGWPAGVPDGELISRHVECSASIYSVREQLEMPRAIAGVDALFVPHYNIPVFSKAKKFVTVHDIAHLAEPSARGGLHRVAYATAMMQLVRRQASMIFFVSEFTRSEFTRLVGQPLCPTSVVPNSVSPMWKDGRSLGKSPWRRPFIIFVGNVKPHKNLVGLMEAFSLVQERLPADLVVVGKRDGFLRGDSSVQRIAERLGTRVHFTGAMSSEELVRWVASAEALVLPSLYEGFGIPPIEAMSVGVPVVVSNIPALRETCGDAAGYVDPTSVHDIANGLVRVVTDKAWASELRERGRLRAIRFAGSDASASLVENVLERIV